MTAPHHWPACAYFWHALASLSCFWRASRSFTFRLRNAFYGGFDGALSAAESTVLLRAVILQPINPLRQPIQGQSFHHHPPIHLFAFSWFEGAETAPGRSAVSQPCPRRCSRIHGAAQGHGQSFHPIPPPSIHPSISLCFYSWFEGAETAPGPQTNGPPLGPESCWGSAVSQPCPRRCFCSRIQGAAQGHGQSFHPIPYPSIHLSLLLAIHGAAQGHGQSFHPIPPPSIHPSIYLSLLLAGSKVLKRPLVRRPIGHPLGVNPAGVLLFRNRALGGVSVAESTVLLRAAAKASTFHPIPLSSIHPSIHLFAFIAGSKVLKRPLVRKPMGHPLGLNPAGVLLFRNRALGGVSAAESTVLHIQVAQCFLWLFRRCSFGS